jgi:hypothetical protein
VKEFEWTEDPLCTVEQILYAYRRTVQASDPLRKFCMDELCRKPISQVMEDEVVQQLLEEGGDVAKDLLKRSVKMAAEQGKRDGTRDTKRDVVERLDWYVRSGANQWVCQLCGHVRFNALHEFE